LGAGSGSSSRSIRKPAASWSDLQFKAFGRLINRALQLSNESSADAVLDLLQISNTADTIERYSTGDPMEILRINILDKDTWKFSLLSKINEFLAINSEESMNAWGHDHVYYVSDFVYRMSQSSDYEDLDNAIDELRGVSSILDIDLDDSISELESYRDSLPPEADDDDYERYRSTGQEGSSSHELDNVFASLLE
jgi:hypothetical protein